MQLARSLIFNASMYAGMTVIALVFFPFAVFSRDWAHRAADTWARNVIWTAGWMVGLKCEVRGTPPTGEVMIAAKHQSILDILMIYHAVPRAKFIMKRELIYAPIFGQYALRIGCVPVDRGKRGTAITRMKEAVARGTADPGQLVIYPQGTRVPPGVTKPYKVGSAVLYQQLGQTCVPAATNVGYFWPRRGFLRKPGTAIVEFLEPIPPGLEVKEFMARLENEIESASDRLAEEATRNRT